MKNLPSDCLKYQTCDGQLRLFQHRKRGPKTGTSVGPRPIIIFRGKGCEGCHQCPQGTMCDRREEEESAQRPGHAIPLGLCALMALRVLVCALGRLLLHVETHAFPRRSPHTCELADAEGVAAAVPDAVRRCRRRARARANCFVASHSGACEHL